MQKLFRDRADAGRRLAEKLRPMVPKDTVILALPRGGVPVAFEIASQLDLAWDVLNVKKIATPAQPELAIGALAEDGEPVWNAELLRGMDIREDEKKALAAQAVKTLGVRSQRWRQHAEKLDLSHKTVVLVDDGIATGYTMRASIDAAKKLGAAKVIVATPLAHAPEAKGLGDTADEVVVLSQPSPFHSVGHWYQKFEPISDEHVRRLLQKEIVSPTSKEVIIEDGALGLSGDLAVPGNPKGLVIFAHGSGSSRRSPRNRLVARLLNQAGFATLLFDLLTPVEESHRINVFDVDLLSGRLRRATDWAATDESVKNLPVAYFGASTGAAAALVAAAKDQRVRTVISRGGRVDLAAHMFSQLKISVLLIVGGKDVEVLRINETVEKLLSNSRVYVVPNAGHLFEEDGALEAVVERSTIWLNEHLRKPRPTMPPVEEDMKWQFPYGF